MIERRLNHVVVDLKLVHEADEWESIALSVKARSNDESTGNVFDIAYDVEFLVVNS